MNPDGYGFETIKCNRSELDLGFEVWLDGVEYA